MITMLPNGTTSGISSNEFPKTRYQLRCKLFLGISSLIRYPLFDLDDKLRVIILRLIDLGADRVGIHLLG